MAPKVLAASLLLVAAVSSPLDGDQPPPLLSRASLFGNPERASPQTSPDGKRLAWRAPGANGVLQVWVKTLGQKDDKAVTADKKRPVPFYRWGMDSRTLLYVQD